MRLSRFSGFSKNICLLAASFLLPAAESAAIEGKSVMDKVDSVINDSFKSTISRYELSTCEYSIDVNKMKCKEKPRVVVIESTRKDYGDHFRDSRTVSTLLQPISEKGIGMLTYGYEAYGKENDTWLYLPALGKVRRIVSSNDGSDKFFGSEFLIENMETRKVGDFTYKILSDTTYEGRPVWILELIPTSDKAGKSYFSRIESWIDKDRNVILKENFFDRNDKKCLQQIWREWEQVDNVWIARKVSMNNLLSRRISNLKLVSVAFNIDVADEYLSQRSLTDLPFREKLLDKYRTYMK